MNPPASRSIPLRLPPEAYENHRGRWIALDEHGTRIIASSDDLAALEDLLVARGVDLEEAIFDFVENDDGCLGGAELL
jgi:hypothetical protein